MFWIYSGFTCLILFLLALDLGVFHRKAHVISVREGLGWSAFWICLGLLFSVFIYFGYENHWLGLGLTTDMMGSAPRTIEGVGMVYNDGYSATMKYLTGYLVEKSLSVDNIFVISMIFAFLAVPPIYQHRVLFWGIVGALLMRGVMIAIGAAMIAQFTWIIYVFGGFLIITGVKMLVLKGHNTDPHSNIIVRFTRKLLPITQRFHGQHFFVRAGSKESHEAPVPGSENLRDDVVESAPAGTRLATPLLLALVMVEFTDLIFAVDSIPAIFAITGDPFLAWISTDRNWPNKTAHMDCWPARAITEANVRPVGAVMRPRAARNEGSAEGRLNDLREDWCGDRASQGDAWGWDRRTRFRTLEPSHPKEDAQNRCHSVRRKGVRGNPG